MYNPFENSLVHLSKKYQLIYSLNKRLQATKQIQRTSFDVDDNKTKKAIRPYQGGYIVCYTQSLTFTALIELCIED